MNVVILNLLAINSISGNDYISEIRLVIKEIGNQTYLVSTLSLKNSGFIDTHSNKGQSVKLEKQRNVTIPKYIEDFTVKYMKEVDEE